MENEMRWKSSPIPKYGDVRIIRIFLFFPRCVQREWRWLEFASIFQIYQAYWDGDIWEDIAWEDKK